MFVLSSARLRRLSSVLTPAMQPGTGTGFQLHSGLLRWAEPLGSKDPEPSTWILCSGTGGAVVQRTLTMHLEPQILPNPT